MSDLSNVKFPVALGKRHRNAHVSCAGKKQESTVLAAVQACLFVWRWSPDSRLHSHGHEPGRSACTLCEETTTASRQTLRGNVCLSFQLDGVIRVVMEPLLGDMPLIGALSVFFLKKPVSTLTFDLVFTVRFTSCVSALKNE